jgi:hypothetical protein
MNERKLMVWSLYARRAAVVAGLILLAWLLMTATGCTPRDGNGNIIVPPPKEQVFSSKIETFHENGKVKFINVTMPQTFKLDNEVDTQNAIKEFEAILLGLKAYQDQLKPPLQ